MRWRVACLLLWTGCSSEAEPFTITEVSPSAAVAGAPVELTVTATPGAPVRARVDFSDPESGDVRIPTIRVVGQGVSIPLGDVALTSSETLRGRLAGLSTPGLYDVVIEAEDGDIMAEDALAIIAPSGERRALRLSLGTATLNTCTPFRVDLLDANGDVVEADRDLTVELTSPSAPLSAGEDCTNATPELDVVISAGESSATFAVDPIQVGTFAIEARSESLEPAEATFEVLGDLAIAAWPGAILGNCIQVRVTRGRSPESLSFGVSELLEDTPLESLFYADVGCTERADDFTFLPNRTQVILGYRPSSVGELTLKATTGAEQTAETTIRIGERQVALTLPPVVARDLPTRVDVASVGQDEVSCALTLVDPQAVRFPEPVGLGRSGEQAIIVPRRSVDVGVVLCLGEDGRVLGRSGLVEVDACVTPPTSPPRLVASTSIVASGERFTLEVDADFPVTSVEWSSGRFFEDPSELEATSSDLGWFLGTPDSLAVDFVYRDVEQIRYSAPVAAVRDDAGCLSFAETMLTVAPRAIDIQEASTGAQLLALLRAPPLRPESPRLIRLVGRAPISLAPAFGPVEVRGPTIIASGSPEPTTLVLDDDSQGTSDVSFLDSVLFSGVNLTGSGMVLVSEEATLFRVREGEIGGSVRIKSQASRSVIGPQVKLTSNVPRAIEFTAGDIWESTLAPEGGDRNLPFLTADESVRIARSRFVSAGVPWLGVLSFRGFVEIDVSLLQNDFEGPEASPLFAPLDAEQSEEAEIRLDLVGNLFGRIAESTNTWSPNAALVEVERSRANLVLESVNASAWCNVPGFECVLAGREEFPKSGPAACALVDVVPDAALLEDPLKGYADAPYFGAAADAGADELPLSICSP